MADVDTQPRRKRSRWLLKLVGPAVLVAILASLDRRELLSAFARTELSLLLWAYPVVVPTIFLRAWRWGLLIDPSVPHARYRDRLGAYAYALFAGVATPGRVGEFVKTVHLTRAGAPFGRAFSSVLLDRLLDVGLLFVVGLAGFLIIAAPDHIGRWAGPIVAFVLIAGMGLSLLLTRPRIANAIGRMAAAAAPANYRGWIETTLADFFDSLRTIKLGALAISALITIACWILTYLGNYLLSRSLGLGFSFAEICGISAICSLVTLVPISVMGAGTRDAALVVILARYGYGSGDAVALSALFLTLPLSLGLLCSLSLLSPAAHFDDAPKATAPREG
ncbi:MAG: flippase-like domain-containing protein [Myxococcales bacterium]|nr:flippase-like domain-containing protein [Myxococcales bacterium]